MEDRKRYIENCGRLYGKGDVMAAAQTVESGGGGWRLVHLLDDLLFVPDTYEEAERIRDQAIADLASLGFCVSWKKAVLKPTQCIRFLGVVVDSRQMRFFVPGDKIMELEELIKSFLEEPDGTTYRRMAKIAGRIISMHSALAPARLLTRETYQCIRPADDWDAVGTVTAAMVLELAEVVEQLRTWNVEGSPIRRAAKMRGLRMMMDGSTGGFGVRIDGVQRDLKWTGSRVVLLSRLCRRLDRCKQTDERKPLDHVVVVEMRISVALLKTCQRAPVPPEVSLRDSAPPPGRIECASPHWKFAIGISSGERAERSLPSYR